MPLKVITGEAKSQDLNDNFSYLESEKADTTTIDGQLALKADQVDLDTTNAIVSGLAEGSPKGVYATLAALQAAYPTGDTGIYVVTADGNWYYWNGSAWTAGGIYQSTGISANSIDITMIKLKKWAELLILSGSFDIDVVAKTVTVTGTIYAYNDDGFKVITAGSIAYTDGNANYICVNKDTGDLFTQDITQVTAAYAYVICRIVTGKVYTPSGFGFIKINGNTPTGADTDFELADNSVTREKLTFVVGKERSKLYSLADAWNAWKKNEKFPICIVGDSTTESTTDPISYNVLGTDHAPANAYPTVLQQLIRDELSNTVMRVYNAGFSSKNAVWSYANIDDLILNNVNYADTKMVGIRHGINDPLENATTEEYIDTMRTAMRGIIDWCFTNNIQPFLITPQATLIAYPLYSPGYTSAEMVNISLSVIRELAAEYNLEIIDNQFYTKLLQLNVNNLSALTADGLHYKIEGHAYQAGLMFAEFNKETIKISESQKISFTNPEVRSEIGAASKLSARVNGFNSSQTTSATGTLFKVYLFNHFKYDVDLNFTFTTDGDFTVTVNDVDYILNDLNTSISVSGMGLIHIEVKNTSPNNLTLYGLEIV